MAVGIALSGCIDFECPAEFARPTSRERFCGHTGNVAAPSTYRLYQNPNAMVAPASTTVTTTRTVVETPPMIQNAPNAPVVIETMPPPGQPIPLR